ncbi:WxL protein host-binding domain-containing protein [Enterococcus hirae]|uniref:WxL protein host-binding domain-containing protein n=1 Tax=Enterococcus hirae TaxID=1354 RepID=UPI003709AD97
MFSEATVSGQILYLKNNKIISTQKKENISIAPYSSYPFQFDWNKKRLRAWKIFIHR